MKTMLIILIILFLCGGLKISVVVHNESKDKKDDK